MNHISKHEKAIRILEAINRLTNRILHHETSVKMSRKNEFGGIFEHYTERIKIDTAIRNRLKKYYNEKFKLCG